jgi:molybdopterin converting factor small subunit
MVTIKIYGTLRLKCGLGYMETYTDTIKDACRLLSLATGTPEKEFRHCNFAVNGKKVGIGTKLSDGDELVLLAPSGGG